MGTQRIPTKQSVESNLPRDSTNTTAISGRPTMVVGRPAKIEARPVGRAHSIGTRRATMSMPCRKAVALGLAVLAGAAAAQEPKAKNAGGDVAGTWMGTLKPTPQVQLRLV